MENAIYDKKITWWQNAKLRIIILSILVIIVVGILTYSEQKILNRIINLNTIYFIFK